MKKLFVFICLIALCHTVSSTAGTCGKTYVEQRPNPKIPEGARIYGGIEARPHSHPWLISMHINDKHACGGALLRVGKIEKTDIVLLAAHCITDVTEANLTVHAGIHEQKTLAKGQKVVKVEKMKYHEKYQIESNLDDVAILKLSTPVEFSQTIQPICLVSKDEVVTVDTIFTVAGWGITKWNPYVNTNELRQVGVPLVDGETCATNYKKANQGEDLVFPYAMICAGRGGKDSCTYDSGGPLILEKNGQFFQHGIVSFGNKCAEKGYPGIYTRVSNYLPWIQEQIKNMSSLVK